MYVGGVGNLEIMVADGEGYLQSFSPSGSFGDLVGEKEHQWRCSKVQVCKARASPRWHIDYWVRCMVYPSTLWGLHNRMLSAVCTFLEVKC